MLEMKCFAALSRRKKCISCNLEKLSLTMLYKLKKKWHVIEKSVVSHNTFFVSERALTILLDILRGYGVFG